jgi:drug/metabolite transporter (DMT)-like permease
MTEPDAQPSVERTTVAAFAAVVVFGGLNAFAVKASNAELAPFWGATLRFAGAAAVLAVIAAWRRPKLPRGRALLGSATYGLISFGTFYALLYPALLSVPAGLAMVLLALAPLLTLVLAALLGQEQLRARSIAGALAAMAGTAMIVGDRIGAGAPIVPILMVVGGAAAVAASSVVIKGFPAVDPVANNLVAMSVGAVVLAIASAVVGEAWSAPTLLNTWLALAYLVALGSVAMFVLYVYVVGRWTATAAAYTVVLMPLVTVPVGLLLAGEAMSPVLLLGGAVILAGVYVGAITSRGVAARSAARTTAAAAVSASVETPGCP